MRGLRVAIDGGGRVGSFRGVPRRSALQAMAARWTVRSGRLTLALASAWREVLIGAGRAPASALRLPAATLRLARSTPTGARSKLRLALVVTDASGFRVRLRVTV
ncbi:MAG: hypothetical protein ACYCXW_15995 [Solirubrobacteraceae bacterium]